MRQIDQGLGQRLMFALTGLALVAAFYLQYYEALQPCPLCLMQRGIMIVLALLAGFGMFCVSRIILILEVFFSGAGAFFAARQLWLQALPIKDTGVCLPEIELLIHKLPWHEVLHTFFWGGASCGEVVWTFLGLSMAAWSLMFFSLIGIFGVFLGAHALKNERV